MKNKILGMIFGKDNKLSGAIALTITALIVLGCTCNRDFNFNSSNTSDGPRPANTSSSPTVGDDDDSPAGLSENDELVRDTILDFADAVEAGDFTYFRGNTAKAFQRQYTVEKINTAFQGFIDRKFDLVPIMKSAGTMQPQYISAPKETRQTLVMAGKYATSPMPTWFDLQYIKENGSWKLTQIIVGVSPTPPDSSKLLKNSSQ